MSAHTPGPWVVVQGMKGKGIHAEDGTKIASVVSEVDAPVLAAAPEMLEALEAAHAFLAGTGVPGGFRLWVQISAAIFNATGVAK